MEVCVAGVEPRLDCWTDEEYNEVLDFVERHLWLFVQENAAIHRPKHTVCNLAQLNYQDFKFLQRVHFLLSESIQKSVRESTPRLLRRLVQSTDRMTTELKGSVKGNVDWNQTLKRRMGAGFSNPTVFVTRVAVKTYDLLETQALKYLLTQVNYLCIETLGSIPEDRETLPYEQNQKWKEDVRSLYYLTNIFLKNAYIRNIGLPKKITDIMLQRVRCARSAHFKSIYDGLRLYRRLFIQEEQETLRDCFARGVLKPLSRDTLYEVYILFVTLASLAQAGWNRESFRLIGYGKGAITHYKYGNTTLHIYYQTLPTTFAQNSLYTNLLRKYQIDVSLRRPDIIFKFDFDNGCYDFKLIEIKRTQNKHYLVDSIYKVLGYLKDFEQCFLPGQLPYAILVGWEGIGECKDIDDILVILNKYNYNIFIKSILIKYVTANQNKF